MKRFVQFVGGFLGIALGFAIAVAVFYGFVFLVGTFPAWGILSLAPLITLCSFAGYKLGAAKTGEWHDRYGPPKFSLRTMLIATTLVAVVLGLVVWLAR